MDFAPIWKYLPQLITGFQITLWISLISLITSMAMGIVLVVIGKAKNRAVQFIARIYTEVILGIPLLVLVYVIFFVLPDFGITLQPLQAGILALTLYYAPYMAEAMRGAVNAVPNGQIEAGLVTGLSRFQIAKRVVAPQAIGVALPVLTGISIGLCKDTAILSVISVMDLTFQTKQVVARTYAPFETYVVVAAMYWSALSLFEVIMRRVEKRVTRYRTL